MSVHVLSKVKRHYPGAGGEYTLALCLADVCNDEGASIWPSVQTLARDSRQSERTVQRQLKAMVAMGWLEVVAEGGGCGRSTRYRINPAWIESPESWRKNGDKLSPFLAQNGDTSVTLSSPQKGDIGDKKGDIAVSPKQTPNLKTSPPTPPQPENSDGCAVPSDIANTAEGEVRKLAEWMLAKLRQLNPQHREPNWRRWEREIRLMATRDQRTLREIAQLFAWANADPFWSSNILSPGKLRQKWDELVIKRAKAGGRGAPPPPAEDRGCVRCGNGTPGRRQVPGVGWLCNHHLDEMEAAVHE